MNISEYINIADEKTTTPTITITTAGTAYTTAVSKTEYESARTRRTLLDGLSNISDEQ
jgi:hypothetical protein